MADIQQPSDDHVMGIGPSGGVYGGTRFVPNAKGPGEMLQPEWIGVNSPRKTVSCQKCGRKANVPVKWSDAWLCHKCNPDIRR